MSFTTILWDMDGTLLNTLDDMCDCMNVLLRRYSMPERSFEEIREFVGNGIERLVELAIPDGRKNPKFSQFYADFLEYYKLHCNDLTAPYAGIPELLARLKQDGWRMAVVSNKADAALQELNQLYFGEWLDAAIGARNGIALKPAAAMPLLALEALDSTVDEAIYIGDSEVDMKTAENSGLLGIYCAWGFRGRARLTELGAKYIADSPSDIPELLKRLQ